MTASTASPKKKEDKTKEDKINEENVLSLSHKIFNTTLRPLVAGLQYQSIFTYWPFTKYEF